MSETVSPAPVTDADRTMAMWAWMPIVGGLVALYILIAEEQRQHPFRKFHAVNSLLFNIAAGLVITVLSIVLVGLCLLPVIWAYQGYVAYKAYQGEWTTVPGLTDLARSQGWI